MKAEELFHTKEEQLIAVLGQGYLSSLVTGDGVSKAVLALSDKRLYYKGRLFEFKSNGLNVYRGNRTVSVEDVTGVGYRSVRNPSFLLLGCLIALLFFLFTTTNSRHDSDLLFSMLMLVSCFGGLLAYVFLQRNFLVIEYAGGQMGVPCNWYSYDEIENFQKSISIIKEERKKQRAY